MTCSGCDKRTDGQPIITLYAQVDGNDREMERFTGVIWCSECAPTHHQWLADDLDVIASLRVDS